jgi:hypothetical protein
LLKIVNNCSKLEESIEKYIEEKSLKGNNCYLVPGHGLQEALVATQFLKFPPALRIHLRQFEYNTSTQTTIKIQSSFEWTNQIDQSRFLADRNSHTRLTVYELFGILVHVGIPSYGHYWACVIPAQGGIWWKFDDASVSPVDEEIVLQKNVGKNELPSGELCLVLMSWFISNTVKSKGLLKQWMIGKFIDMSSRILESKRRPFAQPSLGVDCPGFFHS